MKLLKIKFRIYLTNWVNILGIFLATYISIVISDINNFPYTLFFSLYSIIGYGFMFWCSFLILILILDFILINSNNIILRILIIEWFIISIPFAYWCIKYNQWIFGVAIVAFLLTQFIRKKSIIKIIENTYSDINNR
jgi:hypothetical protein